MLSVERVRSWSDVAADFPVNEHLLWLNSCGIAPMPQPVHDAVRAHLAAYASRGIFGIRSDVDLLAGIQNKLAEIIGAAPADIAPIHHTTEGMTFVSLGLDVAVGDRVVLMANEYPSNVYPWQHLAGKGVELVSVADGPTPADVVASARELITPRTRVLAVSAVHWCTGMPLPLAELGALCAERGVLFVVDGAQGVGHVPIDVRAQQIDVMAFSAWKWLLGPLGLGALYMSGKALSALRFPFKGTGSVVDDHTYFPYRDDIKPGVERYVVSTQSFTDWTHFDASLTYLQQIGWQRVQQRNLALAADLRSRLRRLAFDIPAASGSANESAIVVARHTKATAAQLVAGLERSGIVAAERMGFLRLAPHIHLTEAKLERAAQALAELLR